VKVSDLAATREAMHAVCEHVLAAALYAETKRLGLRVVAEGFATPPFGPDGRTITIGPDHLTVTGSGGSRSGPYPTLRVAAEFVGIEPGAPQSVYTRATPLTPDAPLGIDVEAATTIIDWYVKVSAALAAFAPGALQTLWPEHLDVAIRHNDCNFGGLAGDATIPEPYVYVGPPSVPAHDPFFTKPFGAARTWRETPAPEPISAFFTEGARRAAEVGTAGP
jgi:hypothetical protein